MTEPQVLGLRRLDARAVSDALNELELSGAVSNSPLSDGASTLDVHGLR